MKIITWNCNMAFRKKAAAILDLKPDILVVQECEHPDKLKFPKDIPIPTDMFWMGSNLNKGIGVFSYGHHRFKLIKTHNPSFKMIIPILVTGGHQNFNLYAIWANNPADPDGQYVTQVWKAIHHYDKHLKNKASILIGDFNSNTIWDRPTRAGNHSNVVQKLSEKGIESCYHNFLQQAQGEEPHPTFYLYRHKDKPYHLDYCFASKDFIGQLESVEIGEHAYWTQYSDHVPIITTFKD